jgi:hypothetical protein
MAKALIIAFRNRRNIDARLFSAALSAGMTPDNLVPAPPLFHQDRGLVNFVFNPTPLVRIQGANICLGRTTASDNDAFSMGADRPDGTFALFRGNERRIEALTDYTGSRAIWYAITPHVFVAGTSQRMMVAVLGLIDFNPLCVRWLLASGTTGPGVSWDKRFRIIEPNSTVRLHRDTWRLEYRGGCDFRFVPETRSNAEHREALRAAVEESIRELDLAPEQWTLALSGGMDSRALLYFLKDKGRIDLMTWGTDAAQLRRDGDAYIARELANACHLPHRYFRVQMGSVPFRTTLRRFLQAGEGRVDHFPAYVDGLAMWAEVAASRRGVLRGYDALGRKPPVANAYHVRRANNLLISRDYVRTPIPPELAVDDADLPEGLRRCSGEPLEDWRDRLWLEHRTPNVTAALDEIKTSYVEIANPLLCRRIVDVVRRLPTVLRNDKMLFASIVRSMFPSIPYAARAAVPECDDVLEQRETIAFFKEVLQDRSAEIVLPASFRAGICTQLDSFSTVLAWKRHASIAVKAALPQYLENVVRRHIPREPMNFKRLAARAVMAIEMHRMLNIDARLRPF